jgi:hypothetical protein
MYRKSGTGYVLVITDTVYNVNTGKKGANGMDIIVDVAFNPMEYAFNHADVYQLPIDMGRTMIMQVPCGVPGYGPINMPSVDLHEGVSNDLYAIGGVYKYKYSSDIEPDVQIGDRIYFKPRTLNNKANLMGTLKDENGKPLKYIYKVPYENIFCAVRDGNINMIGAWTLLDPIIESWESILKPTYYPYKNQLGEPIERPKKEWIQTKVAPQHDNQVAKIAHIGKPLKGDYCDFESGMKVIYRKQVKTFFQNVEGKKYIVLGQDQLMCEVISDCTIK